MNYYSQSQTICSNQLSWSYIIFYKNQLLRFKISENIIYLTEFFIIPYLLSCMVNIFVSKCSNSIPNIKPFVHFTTRPRTDVVKKGWYLGKRAKGIDIGLQGACKGENPFASHVWHRKRLWVHCFGLYITVVYVAHARYMLQMISKPEFFKFLYPVFLIIVNIT